MDAAIDWYEANPDHDLDLEAWAHLLAAMAPDDYCDPPLPPPTNVLPTLPTIDEYRRNGDTSMSPKAYVLRIREQQGYGLWNPWDASWNERQISSCLAPKVVAYHRHNDHGDTGCRYFAHAGFAVTGQLTPRAKQCLDATEALIRSTLSTIHPNDTSRKRKR